jgi:hypothetical protein
VVTQQARIAEELLEMMAHLFNPLRPRFILETAVRVSYELLQGISLL